MGDNARVLSFPQTPKMGKLPKRTKNKDLRTREYLTEQEVETANECGQEDRTTWP